MPNETNIRKLENGRAEFAYKCVEEAKKPDKTKYRDNIAPDYKSYVKKIPVLIQTNGLGNTLAFIVSKGKTHKPDEPNNAYDLIYTQLSQWLRTADSVCAILPPKSDLLEFVISQPSAAYYQITAETLAFLNWLRRLAEGMIEGEKSDV